MQKQVLMGCNNFVGIPSSDAMSAALARSTQPLEGGATSKSDKAPAAE